MNNTQTPPLTWLRAFEAAGRLGSFKLAAEELSVSPSTISHQIRDLEQRLGSPLFHRRAGAIELTDEAALLLTPLSSGFALISAAFETSASRAAEFRIGSMPFLTNEVLLPEIDELKRVLGYSQISFRSETSVAALSHSSPQQRLDAVIRYTNGDPGPGTSSLPLFDIELVPVQAVGKPPLNSVTEILEQPIVKIAGPFDAWREWAKHHKLNPEQLDQSKNIALETDNYHAATLAVARGDGLCLGVMPFMQPWLRNKKIQAQDAFRCSIGYQASLVFASYNKNNPALLRLRDWLVDYLA